MLTFAMWHLAESQAEVWYKLQVFGYKLNYRTFGAEETFC